jgi:hypothetical protein
MGVMDAYKGLVGEVEHDYLGRAKPRWKYNLKSILTTCEGSFNCCEVTYPG